MNPKKLNITVLLVTILVLVPTFHVVAESASTIWISSGIYPNAYSYTVWNEGSYYFAKDAYGKQPSWSGITNASQVVTNCIHEGVSIFFSEGTFAFTDPIRVTVDGVHFQGTGIYTTTLIFKSGASGGYLFEIGDGITKRIETTIRDFYITASSSYLDSDGLILLNNTGGIEIEHCRIQCFSVKDKFAIVLEKSSNAYIDKCTICNVQNGINLMYRDSGSSLYLTDSYIDAFDYGARGATVNFGISIESSCRLECDKVIFETNPTTGYAVYFDGLDNQYGWFYDCKWEHGQNLYALYLNETGGYEFRGRVTVIGGHMAQWSDGLNTIYDPHHKVDILPSLMGYESPYYYNYFKIPIMPHPDTTNWGDNMTGTIWFDSTYSNIEFWNGTHCIYWNASGTGVQP
jgi:hypothetical protein